MPRYTESWYAEDAEGQGATLEFRDYGHRVNVYQPDYERNVSGPRISLSQERKRSVIENLKYGLSQPEVIEQPNTLLNEGALYLL